MKSLSKFMVLPLLLPLVASCSDDSPETVIDDSKLPALINGAMDIANGHNVLLIDADELPDFSFTLGSKRNLVVDAPERMPFGVRIVTDSDTTRRLVCDVKTLHELDAPTVYTLHLHTLDDSQQKDLQLVVRPKGSGPTDVGEYAYNIGRGTKYWDDLGNVTYPIIEFDQISAHLTDNVNNVQKGVQFEIGGTRYEETMNSLSVSLGLSAQKAGKGKACSGGGTFSQEKCTKNKSSYEFYLGYYSKVMSEVKMNTDWLANIIDAGELFALLDATANDALNNPGSGAYKQYSNDRDGVFKFLDHYGTHVITQASFGGNYIYMYGRRENAYETSVSRDASANITLKFPGESGKATTWLQQYQRKHNSPYISGSVDVSSYDYDYQEATGYFDMVVATGGDGDTDITTWEDKFSTEAPSKWVIVSYTTLDSDGEGGLLPISDFILDKDRKAAVEKYVDEYCDSKVEPIKDDPLVLADVMMKIGPDGHKKGDAKSFVGVGPDGKKYVYFPMMATDRHFYSSQHGYCLETNQDEYITAKTDNGHYWYYALGYDSDCDGFSSVRFHDDNHKGWVRRGNSCQDGIDGRMQHNYVMLCTERSGELTYEEKVKAVAIARTDRSDLIPSDEFIGTSGGSEKQLPFASSANNAAFNDYWSSWKKYDGNHFYEGIWQTPHDLHIIFSTKSLPITNLSFGKGKDTSPIQHPMKWN